MPIQYLNPPTWGDGQAPPWIVIESSVFTGGVIMPPPMEAFEPEFIGGNLKTALYTGNIHKAIHGIKFRGSFRWVLLANKPVRTFDGGVLTGYNYMDIYNAIIQTDAEKDFRPTTQLWFMIHGGALADGGDMAIFLYPFRLEDYTPIKAVDKMNVAHEVELKIIVDGYCGDGIVGPLPLNTLISPRL